MPYLCDLLKSFTAGDVIYHILYFDFLSPDATTGSGLYKLLCRVLVIYIFVTVRKIILVEA